MIQWQLHPSTTAGTEKSFRNKEKFKEKSSRNSSRNTTTSNGGTPCASKNEYNDAKIKKLYHYNHNTVKYVAITQLNVWLSHN